MRSVGEGLITDSSLSLPACAVAAWSSAVFHTILTVKHGASLFEVRGADVSRLASSTFLNPCLYTVNALALRGRCGILLCQRGIWCPILRTSQLVLYCTVVAVPVRPFSCLDLRGVANRPASQVCLSRFARNLCGTPLITRLFRREDAWLVLFSR